MTQMLSALHHLHSCALACIMSLQQIAPRPPGPGICTYTLLAYSRILDAIVVMMCGHVHIWLCLCSDIIPVGAGDEYAQTRNGNNNWYGHDSKMTRFEWDQLDKVKDTYFRFYRSVLSPTTVTVRGCQQHCLLTFCHHACHASLLFSQEPLSSKLVR